jgi:hypothetical protein
VAVGAYSFALSLVFLTAVVHKLGVLHAGNAEEQSILARTTRRRQFARPLLTAAIAIEVAIAALLLLLPIAGLAAATALLALYTSELRHLSPEQNCGCLGNATSAKGGMRRNMLLAGLALAAIVVATSGIVEPSPVTSGSAGAGLLIIAVPAALWMLRSEGMPVVVQGRRLARGSDSA